MAECLRNHARQPCRCADLLLSAALSHEPGPSCQLSAVSRQARNCRGSWAAQRSIMQPTGQGEDLCTFARRARNANGLQLMTPGSLSDPIAASLAQSANWRAPMPAGGRLDAAFCPIHDSHEPNCAHSTPWLSLRDRINRGARHELGTPKAIAGRGARRGCAKDRRRRSKQPAFSQLWKRHSDDERRNCTGGRYSEREMPRRFIFHCRVERFIPRRAAAPFGPPTTHPHSRRAVRI